MADWWVDGTSGSNANAGSLYSSPCKTAWATDGSGTALFSKGSPPAAGDRVFFLSGTSESNGAAITLTNNGTRTNPVRCFCVTSFNSGSPNDTHLGTSYGYSVITTGTFGITNAGNLIMHGIELRAATGASAAHLAINAADSSLLMVAGRLMVGTSSASAEFRFGNTSGVSDMSVTLIDTDFYFSNASQNLDMMRGNFIFDNCNIAAGSSVPTQLFQQTSLGAHNTTVRNCDFTTGTSLTTALINVADGSCTYKIENVRLGAGCTLTTGTHPGLGGPIIDAVNVMVTGTDERYNRTTVDHAGTVTVDDTVYKTSGYSKTYDNGAEVPYSLKLVPHSSGVCSESYPLYTDWVAQRVDTTGSKTLSVEVAYDNATLLKDNQLFLDVRYAGTTGQNYYSDAQSVTDVARYLGAGSNHTDTGDGWTGIADTNERNHTLSATFTANENGYVYWRVGLTVNTYTVWVNRVGTVT